MVAGLSLLQMVWPRSMLEHVVHAPWQAGVTTLEQPNASSA